MTSQSTALIVPDAWDAPVPAGWWQRDVLPMVRACQSWKVLDEYEARLAGIATAIERIGGDVAEFEKALRVVEYRRGELLGPALKKGQRNDLVEPGPRVAHVEVPPRTAKRYRLIARHWRRVIFPYLVKETDRRRVTQAHVLQLVHKHLNRAKVDDLTAKTTAPHFDKLYEVIVIDPPWPMADIERDVRPRQSVFDYPTMSEDALREFPLPARADCHVWMWTTQRFLPMAFRLLEAWRLTYGSAFVWHKPGGFQPFAQPQYNCEFVLYARRGTPAFTTTKDFRVCFEAPRGRHSEKPEAFYDMVRRVTAGNRIDIFNRRAIDGFEGWGNEATS